MSIQQIIQKCLNDWKEISGLDFCLLDEENHVFVSTCERALPSDAKLQEFRENEALSIANQTCGLHKVIEKKKLLYLLVVWGKGEETATIGQLAVCQVKTLLTAYSDKNDKNTFFQKLIKGQYTETESFSLARKLHITPDSRRIVLLVETRQSRDEGILSLIRNLFSAQTGDFVTEMDERIIAVIHELQPSDTYEMLEQQAEMLVTMLNTEAMTPARVSYSNMAEDIRELENAYKEAETALEIGKIFYAQHRVFGYSKLGIGRLIYQLPVSVCEMFLREVFEDEGILDELDEETLITIQTFFDNNLNLSETSRNLYVHRNTLMYRFEKLQKRLGLDVRTFEDALTFQIARMVSDYVRHSRAAGSGKK